MAETLKPIGKHDSLSGRRSDFHEQQQQPADVTHRAQRDVARGSRTNGESRPDALEEAVEHFDDGLTVTPEG